MTGNCPVMTREMSCHDRELSRQKWVTASASRAEDPGFDSRLRRGDSSGWSPTSDLESGTPVATLSGAWRYRASVVKGWPRSVYCTRVR